MVVWESLPESEQEQSLRRMGRSKDWVVWCRSRNTDEEQRLRGVDGREIFSNGIKPAKARLKAGKKTEKKGGKGQSVCWKVWWQESNIKCAVSKEYASCWAAIEILRKRIAAGTATFLVQVKAYRGETANDGADVLVDH